MLFQLKRFYGDELDEKTFMSTSSQGFEIRGP
jgi:hypothetical protein